MTNRRNILTPRSAARRSVTRRSAMLGSAGLMGLGLAACGGDDGGSGGNGGNGGGGTENGSGGGGGASGTITLGYIPSWTDGLSTAYVIDNQLTEMGYTVEHQEINDAAVLYTGLAQGDIDIYPSAWPEVTHSQYMDEHGDSIEDLVAYYEGAVLNLSVPDYMDDIQSIPDLQGQADRFGGRIVGIEPGAGLTAATQDDVIPGYGLDGFELQTSSTPAMLTELQNAIDAEEDIVVTLWTPFWAMSSFPVRALEDPDGHFGDPEALHHLARQGFSDEFPEAAEWLSSFVLSNEEFGSLEDTVVNQFEDGQEAEAAQQWIDDNQDVLPEV